MTDAELIVHWLDLRLRANGRQGIRGSDIDMMREIRDDIAAGRYHPTTWNAHPAGKPRPFTSEQLTEAARDAAADEELPPHPQVLRPAKIHVLKCWPAYFEAMRVGRKSFEVRRNDRDFQVGDCIVVQEYNPELGRLSGEAFSVRVVYMLAGGQFGVSEGYCVMGVEPWVASRPYTAGCPESCASRQALAEHLAACEARGADVDPSLDYDRENPERPAHCCPTEALSHFESCPVWTELATLRKVAEAALALRHSGYDGPLLGDEVAPLFAALAELDSKEKST